MTMMMARLCFNDTEASDCIAELESYGFAVQRRVFPEDDYVFVEATINIERAPLSERVSSLLKVLGQVDTFDIRESCHTDDLADRLLTLLNQIMPMGSVTDTGSIPADYIPFEPLPEETTKPKFPASEVLEEMVEDELFELNEKFKLGVNLDTHKTSLHKRHAIVFALRSAGMLED